MPMSKNVSSWVKINSWGVVWHFYRGVCSVKPDLETLRKVVGLDRKATQAPEAIPAETAQNIGKSWIL